MFLSVCLCLIIIGGIVAGVVAYGGYRAYENRADYANRYLKSISEDYEITIGDLALREIGKVEVTDLRVRSRGASGRRDIFTSPRVIVTYDWEVFNETRKLDSILVKEPSLYIDEDTFEAIKESTETGKRDGIDLKALAHFTGSFIVEEGDLFLDLPTTPPIRAKWDFKTDQLGYGKDGMTRNPFLTDLRDLEIGDQGLFGRIDQIQTQWRFNSNLSKVRVEDLKFTEPVVTVMPEWFSPGVYPVQSSSVEGTVSDFDLEVDHMAIDNLDLKILGFNGENGIKTIPDISFKSELVDWIDLYFRKGFFDSKNAVDLQAYDIEIGGGREVLVSAESAVFRASSLRKALHDAHLDSVDAQAAKVLISDGSLSLWRDKTPEQKRRQGKPFRIDRLALPDAQYLMRDFVTLQSGVTMPRVESEVSTTLNHVVFEKTGMHLKGVHSAELSEFVLHGPGVSEQKEPLVRFPKGKLRFDWDKAMKQNEYELLKMVDPVVSFTDEALGNWTENREDRSRNLIGPINRPVYKFHDLDITGGTVEADSRKALDGIVPKVKGSFSVTDEQVGQSLSEFGYRLVISDLQLSNHSQTGSGGESGQNPAVPSIFPGALIPEVETLESEEVVTIDNAFIDFTASGIQRQRRISKVILDGGGAASRRGPERCRQKTGPKSQRTRNGNARGIKGRFGRSRCSRKSSGNDSATPGSDTGADGYQFDSGRGRT